VFFIDWFYYITGSEEFTVESESDAVSSVVIILPSLDDIRKDIEEAAALIALPGSGTYSTK